MKLMFDECFTRDGAAVLHTFLSLYDPPIESRFLVDFLEGKAGVADNDWAPLLKDQEWVVVTRDRGRAGRIKSKGPPLQFLLPKHAVTGIFLSGGLGQASRFELVRAVVTVLPPILKECSRAPKGTRFRVQANRNSYELNEWPQKKGEEE